MESRGSRGWKFVRNMDWEVVRFSFLAFFTLWTVVQIVEWVTEVDKFALLLIVVFVGGLSANQPASAAKVFKKVAIFLGRLLYTIVFMGEWPKSWNWVLGGEFNSPHIHYLLKTLPKIPEGERPILLTETELENARKSAVADAYTTAELNLIKDARILWEANQWAKLVVVLKTRWEEAKGALEEIGGLRGQIADLNGSLRVATENKSQPTQQVPAVLLGLDINEEEASFLAQMVAMVRTFQRKESNHQ